MRSGADARHRRLATTTLPHGSMVASSGLPPNSLPGNEDGTPAANSVEFPTALPARKWRQTLRRDRIALAAQLALALPPALWWRLSARISVNRRLRLARFEFWSINVAPPGSVAIRSIRAVLRCGDGRSCTSRILGCSEVTTVVTSNHARIRLPVPYTDSPPSSCKARPLRAPGTGAAPTGTSTVPLVRVPMARSM